jgi:hypothetical protein
MNFLRLSARVDAVSQRVQTAVAMQKVTMGMKGVVKGMDRAMSSMNLVQMTQLMDKFEKQFEVGSWSLAHRFIVGRLRRVLIALKTRVGLLGSLTFELWREESRRSA